MHDHYLQYFCFAEVIGACAAKNPLYTDYCAINIIYFLVESPQSLTKIFKKSRVLIILLQECCLFTTDDGWFVFEHFKTYTIM